VPSLRPGDFPDTGQLRGDLLAELRLMRDRYYRIGPEIMNGLASELLVAARSGYVLCPPTSSPSRRPCSATN
jgi:hypothetical protein